MTTNFTLSELTASNSAKRLKIDNTPNEEHEENLRLLAETILQPIRDELGVPVIVISAYRSEAVNKAVGGSKTSQHMTGSAADIRISPLKGERVRSANKRLFDTIARMISEGRITVGQLIDEYDYRWIHVSLPLPHKQNQILHLS